MIDLEKLERVKKILEAHIVKKQGIKGSDLLTSIYGLDTVTTRAEIDRGISELVMENRIKRIEYTIPEYGGRFFQFYLPPDAKLY